MVMVVCVFWVNGLVVCELLLVWVMVVLSWYVLGFV